MVFRPLLALFRIYDAAGSKVTVAVIDKIGIPFPALGAGAEAAGGEEATWPRTDGYGGFALDGDGLISILRAQGAAIG